MCSTDAAARRDTEGVHARATAEGGAGSFHTGRRVQQGAPGCCRTDRYWKTMPRVSIAPTSYTCSIKRHGFATAVGVAQRPCLRPADVRAAVPACVLLMCVPLCLLGDVPA